MVMKRLITFLVAITLFGGLALGDGLPAVVAGNMKIADGGNMKSSGDVVVKGQITNEGTITSSSSTLATNVVVKTGGHILNKGTLILNKITYESNDSADGTLLNYNNGKDGGGTVTFTDNGSLPAVVSVSKTFIKGKFYAVSFPFDVKVGDIKKIVNGSESSATFDENGSGDYWILYYDAKKRAESGTVTGDNWLYIDTDPSVVDVNDYVLKAGVGYMVRSAQDADITLIFPSNGGTAAAGSIYPQNNNLPLTAGDKTIKLDYHLGGKFTANNGGWSILGAQQTASYQIIDGNLTFTEKSKYGTSNEPVKIFYVYKYTVDSNSPNGGDGQWELQEIGIDDIILSPFSVFMAQPTEPEDASLGLNMTIHVEGVGDLAPSFRSNEVKRNSLIELILQGNTGSDWLRIRTSDDSSNAYRVGEDAIKIFKGSNATSPEFYMMVENSPIVINRLHSVNENEEIPVGLITKENDTYTIGISRLDGFENTDIYLIDKLLKKDHNLRDGEYAFESGKANTENRFALRIGSAITGLQPSVTNDLIIYAADNTAYVKNLTEGDEVSIYNVAGQLVNHSKATSADQTYRLPGSGVYLVKVKGSKTIVSKIVNK
ncbi:MAG: T9SS type A sorting domain-containing protein [Flavobacteriaceae bacterium]|jgi:hypothetical protein|nr:T9SS type A sorting domain-containing protein [Flavobacteriaceae bacterium]